MSKGYKYRGGKGLLSASGDSIFERDVQTIVNNQIYLPTILELNDPTEGFYNDSEISNIINLFDSYSANVKDGYNSLVQKFKDVGIYSLSKNYDNELLWAYYADGHNGFAIEYDVEIVKQSLNHNPYIQLVYDFNVEYLLSVPKIGKEIFNKKNTKETLVKFLGSKSLSWKHEEEYRLVFENKGLFDIDHRAVIAIYFGYRMQDSEIDYIMNKLKGRGLQYYKMDLLDKSYKLISKQIKDKYIDCPIYNANVINYDIEQLLGYGGLFGAEANLYRDKFIAAIESIKYEPLIKNFYMVSVNDTDKTNLIFTVWANTKSGFPPIREFCFKLNKEGEITRIK